jgi:hypothetical protein
MYAANDQTTSIFLRMIKDVIIHDKHGGGQGGPASCVPFNVRNDLRDNFHLVGKPSA